MEVWPEAGLEAALPFEASKADLDQSGPVNSVAHNRDCAQHNEVQMFHSKVARGRFFADQTNPLETVRASNDITADGAEGVRKTDLGCDFDAFAKVVRTRRSVRAYLPEPIPVEVMDACLDLALLAPTSHNLESWQFIDVRDPATVGRLRHYCLDQAPALQAPNLIVAVARPDFWRCGRGLMLEAIAREPDSVLPLKSLLALKYRVQIPLLFVDGPFHILAPLKRLVTWCLGLFGPAWRVDVGRSGQVLWATKTTALACQTLMLALRAAGYDSCAMEGFDEPRVKRLLKLPRAARVVMVIAAGRRAPGGLMPLYRFDRSRYVQRV